jgi:hypothetical protein
MNSEILTLGDTPWVKPLDEALTAAPLDARLASGGHLFENRDFFAGKSLAELAREQGVGPIKDIGVFAGGFPEDENLDELLAELDRLRGS